MADQSEVKKPDFSDMRLNREEQAGMELQMMATLISTTLVAQSVTSPNAPSKSDAYAQVTKAPSFQLTSLPYVS